jgi:malate/lactate dehydrogenase
MPFFNKLTIIGGAGGVGSTMAFYLGLKDISAQIALIDVRENILQTHLIDLRECFSQECQTEIQAGGLNLLAGSEVVIMTAALSGESVASRDDYLEKNLKLVVDAAWAIKNHCPQAIVIVTTAPTDVFTLVFHDVLQGDRHQILGFCRNDSQRFRWALGQVLNVNPQRLEGLVIGEHGQGQEPIFSTVTIDQRPASLTTSQKKQTRALLNDWYRHWQDQKSGRTTTWTSATSMYRTLLALVGQSTEPFMGSVILAGEYGLTDVALGLPLIAASQTWPKNGQGPAWESVARLELTLEEEKGLRLSAQNVQRLHQKARQLYPEVGFGAGK